jgi:hypothetical protein
MRNMPASVQQRHCRLTPIHHPFASSLGDMGAGLLDAYATGAPASLQTQQAR